MISHHGLRDVEVLSRISLSQVSEVRMLQSLCRCNPTVRVVDEQFQDEILSVCRYIMHEVSNTGSLLGRKVELHVSCMLLESVQELLLWGSKHTVNSVNLIQLIIAREEGVEREYLEEHTSYTPQVHFVPIIPIS